MSNNRTILTTLMGLILVLLSGCLDSPGGARLNLDLLTEDQLVSFDEEYINLTLTDLSPYPTLKEAILEIVDPTTNITGLFVKITYDEMNRIRTEILSMPDNDTYNFIAYDEYLFQISFAVP